MCNVYVFENMLYTLVELSMDEAIDMDEHNFKVSDIFGTISNRIFWENWLMSSLISWRPPQTYLGTCIIFLLFDFGSSTCTIRVFENMSLTLSTGR